MLNNGFDFLNSYLFYIGWVLLVCALWGTGPFHLSYQIYICRIVCSLPLLSFCYMKGLLVISHVLLLILIICMLSLFFFVSPARCLPILLIFSKSELFVSFIFLCCFPVFNFAYLYVSFLHGLWIYFVLLYSRFLLWNLDCLFEIFPLF